MLAPRALPAGRLDAQERRTYSRTGPKRRRGRYMSSRSIGALVCLALLVGQPVSAADPPKRKPLTGEERNAVLGLIKAVDVAQETDVTSGEQAWDSHVLKANQTAYVPFRLSLRDL